jgi:hemerythrin-like metal-binding protein
MPRIEWNQETMSVGHPLVDEQHRKLIGLLNQMSQTLETSAGDKRLVGQALKELCDYTVNHFNTEETLMDPDAYPEYDAHVSEHMECTQAVLDFLNAFSEKNEGDLREFSDFANNWVVNHVLVTDKTLGRFLQGRQ